MKKTIFIAFALFCIAGISLAQNVLTVADTNVPQGGQGELIVNFQFAEEDEISGYEFLLALPDGVSLVPNGSTYLYEKGDGYATRHNILFKYDESEHTYKIVCGSVLDTYVFTETSGMLIKLPLQANESLTRGTTLNASLNDIHLSTKVGTDIAVSDVAFRVVIGEPSDIRTELFETSTDMPAEESNVNVRVYRTINADEWSTICLPFAMTETQVKAAFGDDVQLGNFKGYEAIEDEDENVVGLNVKFDNATVMEANHPYIIKVSKPVTNFTADGVDIVPEEEPTVAAVKRTKRQWSEMIGTYVANTVLESTTLFLSGNKFWYSNGSTSMKAYRAYFDFYDVLTEVEDALSVSSRIAFSFDNSTGIKDNKCEETDHKRYYDLMGRRVANPDKGVFVNDGKKVIIK